MYRIVKDSVLDITVIKEEKINCYFVIIKTSEK
jgi:hypothetical protein